MENLLLARLPGEALEILRPHFERVPLTQGQHAVVPDEPIRHFYFPEGCLLSTVMTTADGATVECHAVGREGMTGLPVLLDAAASSMPVLCQAPGEAVRVRSDVVKEVYESHRGVRTLFNRYVHAAMVAGSTSAGCNRLHGLDGRLCRWLLAAGDGVGSDDLALTHEHLAAALGVRRAGVTEAACRLREEGLISYQRGRVRLLDRGGLEAKTCECYGRARAEYERLLHVH